MYAGHLDLNEQLVRTVDDALSPADCDAYIGRMRGGEAGAEGDLMRASRFPHSLCCSLLAGSLAAAAIALPKPASADWISLSPSPSSSNPPPKPGYLTNSERFILWLTATGMAAPMIYAGVFAGANEEPPDDSKRDLGFSLGGLGFGTLLVAFLPTIDPGEPLFTYTFVGGMTFGMAGVGLGGAFSSSPRSLLLGGSTGYTSVALLRMALSLAGYADYRSGAAAQLTLGIIGATGCLASTVGAEGSDRSYGYGCGVAAGIATLHGMIMVARRDPPWPKKEKPAAFFPAPWVGRNEAGVAIAGAF